MISKPLRGELTEAVSERVVSFRDGISAFVSSMQKVLQPSVAHALFPVLLCAAAAQGDLYSVQTMYQSSEATLDTVVDFEGRTPLHLAASKGHMNVVKYLVEMQKCDIERLDRNHRSALDLVSPNHPELKAYLKKHSKK